MTGKREYLPTVWEVPVDPWEQIHPVIQVWTSPSLRGASGLTSSEP